MLARRHRYWLLRLVQQLRSLPSDCALWPWLALGSKIWHRRIIGGVRVLEPRGDTGDGFFEAIEAAFDLISRHDRIRFRRVLAEIKVIINTPTPTAAAYRRTGRICFIDFRIYPLSNYKDESIVLLARDIVHEATHGSLHSRKIVHTRGNHLRIEEFCSRQELSFGKRLGVDLSAWAQPNQPAPSLRERLRWPRSEIGRTRADDIPSVASTTARQNVPQGTLQKRA